jgi:hypothetical protein
MREMSMSRVALEFAGMGETNYIVTNGRVSGYTEGRALFLTPHYKKCYK